MSLGFNVKNEELSMKVSGLDSQNTNTGIKDYEEIGLLWYELKKLMVLYILIDDVGQPPPQSHPPVSPPHSQPVPSDLSSSDSSLKTSKEKEHESSR